MPRNLGALPGAASDLHLPVILLLASAVLASISAISSVIFSCGFGRWKSAKNGNYTYNDSVVGGGGIGLNLRAAGNPAVVVDTPAKAAEKDIHEPRQG